MQTPPDSPRIYRQPQNGVADDDAPELMPIHWPFWHLFGFWLWPIELVVNFV